MGGRVSILLPTLNEEGTIGRVIDGIPYSRISDMGLDIEVIVVDGHSTDRTLDIAKKKDARIITQKGSGKGCALKTAFKKFKGDYLIMLDSDNTYPPSYIIPMLKLLKKGKFDVVTGSRFRGEMEKGAMTTMNNVGNRFLTTSANVLFPNGHKTSDLCTGMWGFTRKAARDIKITARGFDVEAQLYAKCRKQRLRMKEIPIDYKCRIESPSKLSSLKDGGAIWWMLVHERFSKQ